MNYTHTVLIIDDDQDLARDFKEALARISIRADIAQTGTLGLELMRTRELPYDLVAMEVIVPTLNGVEVCERMHADPVLATIPVVFMSTLPVSSGAFQDSIRKYAIFSHVRDTFQKPGPCGLFVDIVERLLTRNVNTQSQ